MRGRSALGLAGLTLLAALGTAVPALADDPPSDPASPPAAASSSDAPPPSSSSADPSSAAPSESPPPSGSASPAPSGLGASVGSGTVPTRSSAAGTASATPTVSTTPSGSTSPTPSGSSSAGGAFLSPSARVSGNVPDPELAPPPVLGTDDVGTGLPLVDQGSPVLAASTGTTVRGPKFDALPWIVGNALLSTVVVSCLVVRRSRSAG